MATKKTTKSNKTSHVMNLLTSAPVTEEVESASDLGSGTSTSKSSKAEIDETLLSDFHEAAEKTKQAAEHFDGAVSNFKTAVENFDTIEQNKASESEEKEEKKEEKKEAKDSNLQEEAPPAYKKSKVTVIDESSENDKITNEIQLNLEKKLLSEYDEAEPEFHIVNVMADILKTKDVRGLMQKYGGCTCDKCVADVTALSLTRLPAKYVVLDKDKTSPMIGFYRSKFHADIFVAMMKAVMDVKEHPHHDPNRGKDTTKFDAEERKNLKGGSMNIA